MKHLIGQLLSAVGYDPDTQSVRLEIGGETYEAPNYTAMHFSHEDPPVAAIESISTTGCSDYTGGDERHSSNIFLRLEGGVQITIKFDCNPQLWRRV